MRRYDSNGETIGRRKADLSLYIRIVMKILMRIYIEANKSMHPLCLNICNGRVWDRGGA
jgi:hypothetical protein